MRYLPLLVCLLGGSAAAASISSSVPNDDLPDLTRDQLRQAKSQPKLNSGDSGKQAPVSMTSQELLQQPDLLQNALNTAVSQQNIDNIRFLLPLYRQLPQQDPILAEYAETLLLRSDGHYTEAQRRLQALVDSHPDYAPIRLQLAVTLAQDGQTKEAAKEVKTIRQSPDLPPPVAAYVGQFDQALKNSQKWNVSGNAYYLQDNNVGRAPEQRTYGAWQFSEPRSAHGIGYELYAQKNTPIKGHWALRTQTSAYGKFYWDAHDYDDVTARVEAGPVWHNHQQEIAVMPFYEKRWFATDPYSYTTGGSLRYSRTLSPKWQLFGTWQSGYKKHNDRTYLNGASHNGAVSLFYRTSPQQSFVFGLGGGYTSAKDHSEAYSSRDIRVGWSRDWQSLNNLSTNINTSIQQRYYQAPDIFKGLS